MADLATVVHVIPSHPTLVERGPKSSRAGSWIFGVAVLSAAGYICFHVAKDLNNVTVTSIWPYLLLALALLIALGFEFVNGFHDTGQRGGDSDLHQLAAAEHCGCVVGESAIWLGCCFRRARWRLL